MGAARSHMRWIDAIATCLHALLNCQNGLTNRGGSLFGDAFASPLEHDLAHIGHLGDPTGNLRSTGTMDPIAHLVNAPAGPLTA